MKIGIVGLPNVGKSSLFNLLTGAKAPVAPFPFTTIDRNVGMAVIPDARLDRIAALNHAVRKTPAAIEMVDIAGLIRGAAQGQGLGNTFLAHIRDVQLVLHVLRAFDDPDIPHCTGRVDPLSDHGIVRSEIFLADLDLVDRRIAHIKKKVECRDEMAALERIRESLQRGQVPGEGVAEVPLISRIPEIVVLNLDEDGRFQTTVPGYRLSARLEQDIAEFTAAEQQELRAAARLEIAGPPGLVDACLQCLGMIRFYTTKGEETRAWAIPAATRIVDAAGMIHSDIRDGFIKAEVIRYDDLDRCGSVASVHEKGRAKIEGKDYVVQDGDIILIRFR